MIAIFVHVLNTVFAQLIFILVTT